MTASPEPLRIQVSDGVVLDGEVVRPDDAWAAVVLLHPHPQQGGSRTSFITGILWDRLPRAGVATLRFDFRGVGRSTGTHGAGVDEKLDVEAAIDVLSGLCGDLPLCLVGWSFGADVALSVTDPRVQGWVAIAPPLRVIPVATMVATGDARPKLVLVPEHDQFNPPAQAGPEVAGWANAELVVVNGADHIAAGRTDVIVERTVAFLHSLS